MQYESLRVFRASLSEAFDKALSGEVVIIHRDGTPFTLKASQQQVKKQEGVKFELCKNGHLLADSGRCLSKGCKYGRA